MTTVAMNPFRAFALPLPSPRRILKVADGLIVPSGHDEVSAPVAMTEGTALLVRLTCSLGSLQLWAEGSDDSENWVRVGPLPLISLGVGMVTAVLGPPETDPVGAQYVRLRYAATATAVIDVLMAVAVF